MMAPSAQAEVATMAPTACLLQLEPAIPLDRVSGHERLTTPRARADGHGAVSKVGV